LLLQAASDEASGLKALDEGRFQEAAAIFAKVAAAEPENFAHRFHLGLAYSMAGKDDEAEAAFRESLRLQPGVFETQLNLAQVLMRREKAAEAKPLLEDAVKAKPDHARAAYLLAEALAALRDPGAEGAYGRAMALDPSPAVKFGWGLWLIRSDRIGEAQGPLEEAAKADARYQPGLLRLAEAWERAGKAREALAIYERFPDEVVAVERAANLRLQLGEAGEAVGLWKRAVGLAPTAANHYGFAIALLRSGKAELAAAELAEAVGKEPANAELRLTYARVLRDLRRFDAALVEFRRVSVAAPDRADVWSEIGGLLVLEKRYSEALDALEKVGRLGNEKAGHWFLKALCLDNLKEPKLALGAYERFLALSGGASPDEEFKARERIKVLRRVVDGK
jgi:tetratricopeptide (TPR) repeat protein